MPRANPGVKWKLKRLRPSFFGPLTRTFASLTAIRSAGYGFPGT
jgi:hypothetical protein